jgi:hypothetical protein
LPTAADLIKRDALLDDGWHPLDSVPAPEYIPPTWDGPHAVKRLVDGLRTLMLMPMPRGPRAFGNSMPPYMYDWCDLVWQEEMEADQREIIERAKNKTRVRPSASDIGRMALTISWPAKYLRELPNLIRAVQAVALARARDADIRAASRRLRRPLDLVRERNNRGLARIAAGLVRDRIRIW